MLIVGLTGSMGMGKTSAAAYLASLGYPVFNADDAVHALYEGAAVAPIEAAFPGVAVNGRIDRALLSMRVARSPEALARLEAIVHPLVRQAEKRFLNEQCAEGAWIAVLDIPLLFESGRDRLVDAVIVVSAPPEVQRARLLGRPGASVEKIEALLARQMPDAEKRRRADFVVDTSGPFSQTHAQLANIISKLRDWPAKAYRKWQEMDEGPAPEQPLSQAGRG